MSLIDFSGGKAENDALFDRLKEIQSLRNQENRFQYPQDYTREFDSLLEFSFDGISFPVNNVNLTIKHVQIAHKFLHQDGALVETIGADPLIISADCIFFNTIVPAKSETWIAGELYPTVYQEFITAMSDGFTVRTLVHPFWGELQVKPLQADLVMNASIRDGEIVQCQWIVTRERDSENETAAEAITILQTCKKEAQELDDALNPPPDILNLETPPSFSDFMNGIQGAIDSVDRGIRSVQNTFNEPLNQVNKVIDACRRVNDTAVSSIQQTAQLFKGALKTLEKAADTITLSQTDNKFVLTLILSEDATLAEIRNFPQVSENNSIGDLLRLNSSLTKKSIILAGTQVKYYVSKASPNRLDKVVQNAVR